MIKGTSSGCPASVNGTAGANNGNVSAETIQTAGSASVLNLNQSFTYDAYNRLTYAGEVGGGSPWSQSYSHDAFGNHWVSSSTLPLSVLTPQSQTWFIETTNRLQGVGYDSSGNQQQLNPFTVTYDAENRMASATAPSPLSLSVSYTYDGEGRRVGKSTVSNGTAYSTTYVYDAGGALVAESGNEPADNGTLPSGTQYLMADHLGSTRMSMDASVSAGSIRRYDYLPFGEEIWAGTDGRSTDYNSTIPLSATQDAVNNKFTGKERDAETGLDFFGARYFSAAQGRFTTSDWSAIPAPVPYAQLGNPQSLNLYTYVYDNPLNLVDANGHGDSCKTNPELCKAIRDAHGDIAGGTAAYDQAHVRNTSAVTSYSDPAQPSQQTASAPQQTASSQSGPIPDVQIGMPEVARQVGRNMRGFNALMGVFAGGSLAAGAVIGALPALAPETLYHFTTQAGYEGIVEAGQIVPGRAGEYTGRPCQTRPRCPGRGLIRKRWFLSARASAKLRRVWFRAFGGARNPPSRRFSNTGFRHSFEYMVFLLYFVLYFTVPYLAFRCIRHWTGSVLAAWLVAVATIPVGVVLYARLFEYLKHGKKPGKKPVSLN